MAPLQFRFLGVLEIYFEGQLLPKPATRKSQSLLAYLVLHRDRPHARERLTALFWGDRPEYKARRSLTTALWHIRRSLPDADLILSDSQAVQFDPQTDMWLDLEAFESLVDHDDLHGLLSAVEIYRGEFLEGFYDDWVINVRYRLESKLIEALARLMVIQENYGQAVEALGIAHRLLNHDPLREDAHRLVMRVHYQLGQRNNALEQYNICRKIMQEELSAEPVDSTTELYQAILEERYLGEQPRVVPEMEPSISSIVHVRACNPLEVITVSRLVGRESELNFLNDCWDSVETGSGGLVLISGEAGVGKTRLIEEFSDRLRWRGGRVLWGRCYEFESFLPYQPLAEVLHSVLPGVTSLELENFASWVISQVARLVPEIAEYYPNLEPSSSVSPDQEQSNLFAGILRFLTILSSRGAILIILEDLQWATESSLQMIHYLLRNLAGEPVMIMGSYRSEALSDRHPLWALQQELNAEKFLRPLHLSQLSAKAVDEMLVEMSGLGEVVLPLSDKLYRETDGNPFFLIEIIKALFESGDIRLESGLWQGNFQKIIHGELKLPASVKEAIQDRIRRLDKDTQEALRLAAVIGPEFNFDLLETVWKRGKENTLQALERLLRMRFIEEGTGLTTRDYVFIHHKIQEVAYAGIPRHHREYTHAQIGLAIERIYESCIDEVAREMAYHFEKGQRFNDGLTNKAIKYLIKAGDQARMVYAHQEAIEHYQRALTLLEKQRAYEMAARTLMRLALTHHTAFDFPRARQAYDKGFVLLQRASVIQERQPRPPAPHALRLNWSNPLTLDPTVAYDIPSGGVLEQLFSALVEFSPEMEVVPDLAKEWEVLEEGSKYIFNLRDDACWSDGVPVTARDIEFAWKRMLDPATEWFLASQLYDIKGARAFHQGELSDPDQIGIHTLDETCLVVELAKPACYFLYMLAYLYTVPKHVIEAHAEAWSEGGKMVTNGPFKLKAWLREETILLTRNPRYHGRFSGNVQQVELYLDENSSVNLGLYEADKLDVLDMSLFPPDELDIARQRYHGDYVSLPWLTTDYVGFNVRQAPFIDPRVRRAFVMALDREILADIKMIGTVFPAMGGFIPPGMPSHSPGIALAYDPDQARQLLSMAGYPDGRDFPLVDALTRKGREAQSDYLQEQWHQVLGVNINWQTWESGVFLDKLDHDPPSIFIIKWMADYPDPDSFLRVCPARHYTGWWDEAYNILVEEAKFVKDKAERLKMYQDADKKLIEAAAILPLCYQRIHLLVKPWVKRFPTSALERWFWKDVIIEPH